jgi:hypothetical protein
MIHSQIIKAELYKNYKNKIIYASEVYVRHFSKTDITEASFFQTLERMYKNKEIKKLSKGIYYFPKENEFGEIPISDREIICKYIDKNKGMFVGYHLYSKLRLTTQVSKKINIYTSNLENQTRNIKNISLNRVNLRFNEITKKNIEMLDVLENFNNIEDLNYDVFYQYAKEYSNSYNEESLIKILKVMKYKKSTLSFLLNVLEHFNIQNSIKKYLSPLSKYNHITMNEICNLINQ